MWELKVPIDERQDNGKYEVRNTLGFLVLRDFHRIGAIVKRSVDDLRSSLQNILRSSALVGSSMSKTEIPQKVSQVGVV